MRIPHVFRAVLLASALGLAFSLIPQASASAAAPGDLIKLSASSAVYYVGTDGKRHAFPNSAIYFSWYKDFATVKTVTADEMSQLPLGKNILYRAGTRLVKITSDPKVYAIEPGGVLRAIASETVAKQLYGDAWNKRVDDLGDSFFFNYVVGDALATVTYPNGSIVKRPSDNAVFLIENGQKRRVSDAMLASGRWRTENTLTAKDELADYPNGTDVTATTAGWTDSAQSGGVLSGTTAPVDVPTVTALTLSSQPVGSGYIPVLGDVTIFDLKIAAPKAFAVKRITVRIDATTGAKAAGATLDDDKGGLVYGNNAQVNLEGIRFVNANGTAVLGTFDANKDQNQDQSQTFVFAGDWRPGSTQGSLQLKTRLNRLLPGGEGYKATIVLAGTEIVDAATGERMTPTGTATEIAGAALTTINDAVEVNYSTTPGMKTYVRGQKNAELAGFSLKANAASPTVLRAITVTGYYDEEANGFLSGGDTDNGSETRVRDMVSKVSLYDDKGALLAGPVDVDWNGKAKFDNFQYTIAAGTSRIVTVRGDLSATWQIENVSDRVGFDVDDGSVDMKATDSLGNPIVTRGVNPNGGVKLSSYATIRAKGKLRVAWSGNGGNAVAGREATLGSLDVATEYDSYVIRTLAFRQDGGPFKSITDASLTYRNSVGTDVTVKASFDGTLITFTKLDWLVAANATTKATLKATFLPLDGGALYGESIKIKWGQADSWEMVSQADATIFDIADFDGTDIKIERNASTSFIIRRSTLEVSAVSGLPSSVYGDAMSDVMAFKFKSGPGAVRISRLTFNLSPSDVDCKKKDNSVPPVCLDAYPDDAIELWARANGDSANDFGVGKLLRWYSAWNKETLAENGDASVQYVVMRGGTAIANPVATALVSKNGDYGRLIIEFKTGSEMFIPADTTAEFRLQVNTAALNDQQDRTLGISLLGANDFKWTDIPSGAYTALTGTDATGAGISTTVTVKR